MSVFGLIKKGRQAAKEHKAVAAEKQKAEQAKPTYKHVPTHAAVDALSGAPSSWRHEDRPRIAEQNRRRSAMVANGQGSMGTPLGQNPVHTGMSRVGSALSNVSYPSLHANPMVALPRTYSYHGGMHTPWAERPPTEVVYSQPDLHQGLHPVTAAIGKGKGVDRPPAGSRTSSKAPSPASSSGDSASSQDELEMKPSARHHHQATDSIVSQASQDSKIHRLHPSQRPRRPSDPPPLTTERQHQHQHHHHHHSSLSADRYPPAAMDRYFQRQPGAYKPAPTWTGSSPAAVPTIVPPAAGATIPPMPSLPPMNFGPFVGGSSSSSAAPSSANASIRSSKAGSSHNSPSTPVARPESPNSPVSPVSLAPAHSPNTLPSVASRPPTTPHPASPDSKFDFNFSTSGPSSPSGSPPKIPPEAAITPAPAPRVFHLKQASRSSSQTGRKLDFEPAIFHPEPPRSASMSTVPPASARSLSRSSITASQLPVDFDEGALTSIQEAVPMPAPQQQVQAAQKPAKGKLSKAAQGGGAKLAKKNRWSFGSKPAPVAG